MARQIKKTEKPAEHPLEDVLEIESGTTMTEFIEPEMPAEAVKIEGVYDDKDAEIEDQLQEIYETAMTQFEVQSGVVETVEGKYAARNAEVAVQFLTAALNAVQTKATVKSNKDKLVVKAHTDARPKTLNQNLIMDRNELMKLLEKG